VSDPKFAIICVDDDPMINVMLSFQLRKIIDNNTTIIECMSKPEEVEGQVAELVEFGVKIIFIIVDYQMPKLNGAECSLGKRTTLSWISYLRTKF
jgi:CheY-like chemotaxis protein